MCTPPGQTSGVSSKRKRVPIRDHCSSTAPSTVTVRVGVQRRPHSAFQLSNDEGLLNARSLPFSRTCPSTTHPSTTTLNLDTISASFSPATMSSQPLVLKSNGNLFNGTKGHQCGIISNTFKLQLPDKEYYHYDRELMNQELSDDIADNPCP